MTIDKHIEELIKRTGIGEALAREAEEQRLMAFAAARLRKVAAAAKFAADMPKAQARKEAAEDRCDKARKAFEATVDELSKASQALDQVRDEFSSANSQVNPELRKHADPRVDALRTELELIYRTGPFTRPTHEEKSRAVSYVRVLIDELEQIRVAGVEGEITDIGAALEELQGRVPR